MTRPVGIYSDSNFTGRTKGDGFCLSGLPQQTAGCWVKLRLHYRIQSEPPNLTYEPHGLVALASLYFGCRLELPRNFRESYWDNPYFSSAGKQEPKYLPSVWNQNRSLDGFSSWLDGIRKECGTKQIQKLTTAAERYRQATWEAEFNFELAYLDLIAAVETVCGRRKVEPDTWEQDYPLLAQMLLSHTVDSGLEQELQKAKQKLAEQSRLQRKFVSYLCENADDAFWDRQPADIIGPGSRQKLKSRLEGLYRTRSARLHSGVWFQSLAANAHLLEPEQRLAYWRKPERMPPLDFFAQLVRYALLKYPAGTRGSA